jgi:hypothetical protein
MIIIILSLNYREIIFNVINLFKTCKNLLLIISIVIYFAFNETFAQQSKLSKAVNSVSGYIASEKFPEIRKSCGDLSAVDSVFQFALKVNNYDYSETLLSLMFATVPYREVPVETPILKIHISYPLISADLETFNQKNKNLPRYLFIDSPKNEYGDLDKLAHFFGSAYLSYNSNIFDLGELIGYFVEVFEESFKVQSEIDYRDIDVNYYGRLFGKLLRNDQSILPSQIILLRSLKFFSIIQ